MSGRAAIGFVFCVLLSACGQKTHTHQSAAIDTSGFVKQKIGETGYNISLPKNYTLVLSPGVDYTIYYFQPRDTTDKLSPQGGIFFGNAPGMSDPDSAKSKTDSMKSLLLDTARSWLRYTYKTSVQVQIIIPAKSSIGEPRKMYAFGHAANTGVAKLMAIFSTIRKEIPDLAVYHDPFANDPYKKTLSEQKFGKGQYAISLPSGYSLIEKFQDTIPYYTLQSNTNLTSNYHAIFHFTSHIDIGHPTDLSGSTTNDVPGALMGHNIRWEVHQTGNNYEMIMYLFNEKNGRITIEAFGTAYSAKQLHELLVVYSTLKRMGK